MIASGVERVIKADYIIILIEKVPFRQTAPVEIPALVFFYFVRNSNSSPALSATNTAPASSSSPGSA